MTALPGPAVLSARHAALRDVLDQHELDALLVFSPANITYLTGFIASSALVLFARDQLILASDSRYSESLQERSTACPGLQVVETGPGESLDEAVVGQLGVERWCVVGFEAAHLTVSRHRSLVHLMSQRSLPAELSVADGLVEQLRITKDAWEIDRLRHGARELSAVVKCILPKVLAGRTEAEIAGDIDQALRHAGFERPAFDTIVAAGGNSARPHARATRHRLQPGELVVIDCGGVLDGYCTDMTRTVIVPPAGDREQALLARLAEAQQAAFEAVRPGTSAEAVDAAARAVLSRYGLAERFTHGTGHGLGLELHEAPRLTRLRPGGASTLLAAGMVVTLEPGVYFPNWGGARLEDDVLVTGNGAEWLTELARVP